VLIALQSTTGVPVDPVSASSTPILLGAAIDEPLLDRAGDLGAAALCSLDAVRLTAAESIGPEPGVFLTYDSRLREADVESPSWPRRDAGHR
jgi:hypothetical protein